MSCVPFHKEWRITRIVHSLRNEKAFSERGMKKYIIWDFDGTIACTNDIIIESWQATFRHYLGRELPVREIEATFGETLMHTIGEKIPGADPYEVMEHYRAYQYAHCEGRVYVFDGIRELLDELKARGCMLGVATSRTANSFHNYMKELGLDGYMDEVVSMEDVTKHKPDPESVNAVLVRFMDREREERATGGEDAAKDGRRPVIPEPLKEKAIMRGDTKYDIGCANNAGVDSVLVGWSHYVDEESMAADGFKPTYRIDTPADLLDII